MQSTGTSLTHADINQFDNINFLNFGHSNTLQIKFDKIKPFSEVNTNEQLSDSYLDVPYPSPD